jgi:PKD repeat protein
LLVTVDPTPDVAITTTADTLCPGESAFLVATGATSYVWSPGASLSCTSCSNPEATPASSTTYTVTGTIGSCSSDSYVEIDVDDAPPIANFITSNDTVCEGLPLSVNGAISENAAIFSWTFTGADVTTGSAPTESPIWSTPGTYTIDLTVENTCSETDNTSKSVVVESALTCFTGVDPNLLENGVTSFINNMDEIIYVQFGINIESEITIELISVTGQLVYQESLNGIQENGLISIPVNDVNPALYMLRVSAEGSQTVAKYFIK